MAKQFIRALMIGIIAIGLAANDAAAQTAIAHWSFDSATLTLNGGNITGAADATGLHNAVNTQTAGSGAGSPYTSNPIPAANSIAGKFDQGLTLTGFNNVAGGGGQFLTFPNLTELMTANSAAGAPNYSISYWLNTTTTNSQSFTLMSSWGNAAGNPGKFSYGYGFDINTGTARMRAQTRFNTGGNVDGTDIFANTVNTAALNNGNWHMLTWTFDTTSGQLISYFDGAQIGTFTSTAASKNMILSSSPLGTFGLKGDSGNFINGTIALDEVWVANGVLTPTQIQDGFSNNFANTFQPPGITNLTLEVNAVTGAVAIENATASPIAISSYRITSNGQSLDTSGWDPISTGTPTDGFPQGTGTGDGWEIAPNPSGKELVEWFLTGSSAIAGGGSVALGAASFPTVDVGDHNDDGVVDAADYVAWRKSGLGQTQYDNWQRNFGKRKGTQDLVFQYTLPDGTVKNGTIAYVTAGGGSAVGAALVPEPATAGLWLIAALSCALTRRRM